MLYLKGSVMKSTQLKGTAAGFLTCYVIIVTFGVAAVMGESNHRGIVMAQVEIEEEDRAQDEVTEEQESVKQTSGDSNGLSIRLDRAHFIPLSPISDSPGNQVKMLLGYDVDESSPLLDDTISAVMEVYSSNQTLLRTSSLPEPITLEDSEGSIELATTFSDDALNNVTAKVLLTDGDKIFPITDPLEARIGLGEIRTAASDLD